VIAATRIARRRVAPPPGVGRLARHAADIVGVRKAASIIAIISVRIGHA
jgi:hypothetical protein